VYRSTVLNGTVTCRGIVWRWLVSQSIQHMLHYKKGFCSEIGASRDAQRVPARLAQGTKN
jgi:hypothetical protein